MDRLQIPASDWGQVRLFRLDVPRAELENYAPGNPALEALFGGAELEPDQVEVFDPSDLECLGLTAYLVKGQGVAESELKGDRTRLDAFKGPMVVLRSAAFGGKAQTLEIRAPLRWIGTYREESAPVSFEPVSSDARPVASEPEHEPEKQALETPRIWRWVLLAVIGGALLMGIRAMVL